MNKSINEKIKYIFLIIFAMTQYYVLEATFYVVTAYLGEDFAYNNALFLDSMLCFIMILVFGLNYIIFVKKVESKASTRNYIEGIIIILGLGGIAAIWLNFAETVLTNILPVFQESMESFDNFFPTIGKESYIWTLLSIVILGPIFEEILFRGLIFNYSNKIFGPIFAVFFSGILFGVWHGELVQVIYTSVMGIGIGIVYYKTKSLKLCFVMHIINNFSSTLPDPINTELSAVIVGLISSIMILPSIYLLFKYFIGQIREDRQAEKLNDNINIEV